MFDFWLSSWGVAMQSLWTCWGITGTPEQHTMICRQLGHLSVLTFDQQKRMASQFAVSL